MPLAIQARVCARAAVRAAACCCAAGVGLGAAYLATTTVQHAVARAHGLADAAAAGFSESALRARGEAMSPGALAIAQRHDPYAAAVAGRDSLSDAVAARLGQIVRNRDGLRLADSPAARPFRASGALDSARELECLTQAVYYEARGETPAGQAAVAQVVLNRVRHPAFPKTVCGVVFQGAQSGRACQFSFACDGSLERIREAGAWRRSQKVAARALAGFVMADVGNATHFHAARVGPQWGSMIRVSQVGLHIFYRFGGRAGAPAVFRQPAPERQRPHTVYASILPVMETPRFVATAAPAPAKVEAAPVAHAAAAAAAAPAKAAEPVAVAARPPEDKPPAAKPPTAKAPVAMPARAQSALPDIHAAT